MRTSKASAVSGAVRNFFRKGSASARTRRPASPPAPSAISSVPAPTFKEGERVFPIDEVRAYPRPVTPETFEAEFVAWNQFRALTGVPPVTRADFARTVAVHNANLAKKQWPSALEYMDGCEKGQA